MATIPQSIRKHVRVNLAAIARQIKALETEQFEVKAYYATFGAKPKNSRAVTPSKKRAKRGNVKGSILTYLKKNGEGKAIEIAKTCGLKVTSVNQSLFTMKKEGVVTQDKKRGSPFVLVKK